MTNPRKKNGSNQYTKRGSVAGKRTPWFANAGLSQSDDLEQIAWSFENNFADLTPDDITKKTPVWLHRLAATHPDEKVRAAVAGSKSAPSDLIASLAAESPIPNNGPTIGPGFRVPCAALSNPKCPPEVLAENARSRWLPVLSEVAANPSTPKRALRILANENPRYAVRVALAQNPSLPVGLLERLSEDPMPSVRQQVQLNPSTPRRVLRKMSEPEPITDPWRDS